MKLANLFIFAVILMWGSMQSSAAASLTRREVIVSGVLASLLGSRLDFKLSEDHMASIETRAAAKARIVTRLSPEDLTHVTKILYLYSKDIIIEQGLDDSDDLFVGISPRVLLEGAFSDLGFTRTDFDQLEARLLPLFSSNPQIQLAEGIENQNVLKSAQRIPCSSLLDPKTRATAFIQPPMSELKGAARSSLNDTP